MPSELCVVCGDPVRMQIFKGSGLCSGNCEKRRQEWQAKDAALGITRLELSDPPAKVSS